MKLAYYIWETYTGGGLMKTTIDKMNYWARQGHEVWCVTREQKGRSPFWAIDERVQQVDIDIDYQDVNAISNPLKRFKAFRERERLHLERLEAVLNKAQVDIVINTVFAPEAELFPRLKGSYKKVLESHGVKYALFPKPPRSGWRAWVAKLADIYRRHRYDILPNKYDYFVVLSNSHLAQWPSIKHVSAISNPCTLKADRPATLQEKIILYVGRIGEEKNVSFLVDAWALIAQKYPDWKLRIVGSGDHVSLVEERIRAHSLEASVEMLSHQSEVASLYLGSSIFALSSNHEGQGMVLIEAQTFGVPCVSLDCPLGPRDIISDGVDGFLIPSEVGAQQMFAERLATLIEDESLRLQMGAAALVSSERYIPERIMRQWEELFAGLLR